MPGEVVLGSATEAACRILAALLVAYAVPVAWRGSRGLRAGFPDAWSSLVAAAALAALGAATWVWGPAQLPAPFSPALVAVAVVAPVAVVAFTRLRIEATLDAWGSRMPTWMRWRMPEMGHEHRRKWPHLLMGLYALLFPFLGHAFVAGVATLGPREAAPGEGWGNVLAVEALPWHAAGQVAAVWLLLLLVFVLLPIELARLAAPGSPYPLRRVIEPRLRERERGLFGAHLHIAIGCALAVVALGRDPATWATSTAAAAATILVTVFADAASALVGIRYGRRKWFHNAGKSYAGTFGGTVVAFALCLPVVGLLPALAAAFLFALLDIAAPRPVPVSDNLLNPLGLAALFTVLAGESAPTIPWN